MVWGRLLGARMVMRGRDNNFGGAAEAANKRIIYLSGEQAAYKAAGTVCKSIINQPV